MTEINKNCCTKQQQFPGSNIIPVSDTLNGKNNSRFAMLQVVVHETTANLVLQNTSKH